MVELMSDVWEHSRHSVSVLSDRAVMVERFAVEAKVPFFGVSVLSDRAVMVEQYPTPEFTELLMFQCSQIEP